MPGQLDNPHLEAIVSTIVERERWTDGRPRTVVEVGTGSGDGSTVAIQRALTASGCHFRLVGYEGNADLASEAADQWSDSEQVAVVNEYFMHREDIEHSVEARVARADRDAYLPEFAAMASRANFLTTTPPGPVDLLFIDSFRYTHLAILQAARPWLRPEAVVVMEDDIPGYGELAIIESVFDLRDVRRHELAGHPWPLVEFRIAPRQVSSLRR